MRSVLVVLMAAAMGCGGGNVNGPKSQVEATGGVMATLLAPEVAQAGETFAIRVRLSNDTRGAARVEVAGGPERPYIGLVVARPSGDTVATVFNSTTMLRLLFVQQLASEQFVDFPAELTLSDLEGRPIPPGEYRVTARLLGLPADWISDTRTLVIEP